MKCRICGKEFNKIRWLKPYEDICSDKCFRMNFWNEIVAEKENHVFIDGKSYSIAPEDDDSPFRGCSGRHFKIKFDDGKIVETTNLWCQGEIPEEFRDILKDNAKFIIESEEC